MKYALLGGWGYVGANLAELLDSCVITRKSSKERRPFLAPIFEDKEVIEINEVTEEELRKALEECGADVLVYLIGKIKGSYEEMKEAHVDKALLAYEVSEELGMRFVYTSSVAAMGFADKCKTGGFVMEEDELLEGCEPFGDVSVTKAEGELRLWEKSRGNVGIVRPALFWGRYAYHPEWKLLKLFKKLRIPVPEISVTSAQCMAIAVETAAERRGWYIASDKTLSDLGLKTVEVKLPKDLIKKAPRSLHLPLLVMRYKYSSRYLPC